MSQRRWLMLGNLAIGKMRHGDGRKLEASLVYKRSLKLVNKARSCFRRN